MGGRGGEGGVGGRKSHIHSHSLFCRELSGRELVAEMVFTFLLPEVEKQTLRQRGDREWCHSFDS